MSIINYNTQIDSLANLSNNTLTTDFNAYPYYDDYDINKKYYRILFKPGYAVQARELTQLQTNLQKQIDKFGKHVFKEGSIVLPGAFTLHTGSQKSAIDYVKVRDVDSSNSEINIQDYLNYVVTGNVNNVTATITDVLDGSEGSANTKTIYIKYETSSNSNGSIKTFAAGERLTTNIGDLLVIDTDPTGKASKFRIDEGIVFSKEHFVYFPTQQIILSRYDSNPSCKVGFLMNEYIVSSNEDSSLLDPALEASNYSAPGADRLQIDPELAVLDLDDPIGPPNFVTLFTIKNGIIQSIFDRPEYHVLAEELAIRTYEESGHYVVNGLNVQLREHLNTGSNRGKYTSAEGGNSELLFVGVDPGVAFVRGREIRVRDSINYLTTPKSSTFTYDSSEVTTVIMGKYIKVNEAAGLLPTDQFVTIDLYDTAENRISGREWITGSPSGNKIGEATVVSYELSTGTPSYDAEYRIYLTDIQMTGTNNFSDVKSVYYEGSEIDYYADIIIDTATGTTLLYESAGTSLLYYTGSEYTRSLRTEASPNDTDTAYNFFRTDTNIDISTSGTFTVSVGGGIETFPYSGGVNLSAANKQEIKLILEADANILVTGATVSTTGATANTFLYDSSGSFSKFNIGDKIEVSGNSETFTITSRVNAYSVVVSPTLPAGLSGNTLFKAYKAGDSIDLTGIGIDAGTERTVTGTTDVLMSFDLQETFPATTPASIIYRVNRGPSKDVPKTLRPDRVVKIDCSSAGTTGPFCLGFPDIYQIKSITINGGSDVKNQFILDNGQRDTVYQLGTITPAGITLGGSDVITVTLDYFYPDYTSEVGHFTIDSYPIDDSSTSNTLIRTENVPVYTSPTSGKIFDLRNHIDFRPVKTITATDTTNPASATTNPISSSAIIAAAGGNRVPIPGSQVNYDYSFYLARRDIVVVDKEGNFKIIQGANPSANPITPTTTDDVMVLAVLNIVPYPSLAPAYARLVNRKSLSTFAKKVAPRRYTMRDIGVLDQRIQNLEYYASTSLLEKAASDLKILDENGLDRFKNGIFVDTFADLALADTKNTDNRISVDREEKSIRPIFTMNNFKYRYLSGSNVSYKGDIITLSYEEASDYSVNVATTVRNIERTTYYSIGNMSLFPPDDIWIDMTTLPDEEIDIGDLETRPGTFPPDYEQVLGQTWGSWQRYITGYKVYRGQGDNKVLVGEYSTYSAAQSAAENVRGVQGRGGQGATIETQYNNVRYGIEDYILGGTENYDFGDRIVSDELIPYIRPQTITAYVQGLRPYTRVYAFFDGEPVSQFCTPLTSTQFDAITDGDDLTIPENIVAEGSDLVVDETGVLFFNLRLDDSQKFRTGERVVRIIDSPTNNEDDASTGAELSWWADGRKQVRQGYVLTTHPYAVLERDIQESYASSNFEYIAPRRRRNGSLSCLAYSFVAKAPDDEEGIFLTSVDVFIQRKSSENGIWFEIREMDNAGGITNNTVPKSIKWFTPDQVPLSTDGKTNPLNVEFDEPLFLYNNVQYAFVIHTENIDPNYYIWITRLGEEDVTTGEQYVSRPMTGTFYTTNNNLNWDIVEDADLTCTFYRASFETNTTGTAYVGNEPVDKILLSDLSVSTLTNKRGESFYTSRLTVSGANGTINISQHYAQSNTSLINTNLSFAHSGTEYVVDKLGIAAGEQLNFYYSSNNVYTGISADVASTANARGYLTKYTATGGQKIMHLNKSSGGFKANDVIYCSTDNSIYATVDDILNYRYSVVNFDPSYISPFKTSINFAMRTYSNTEVAGSYVNIDPAENYYYNDERALLSRSNEIANHSSDPSNKVQVTMYSTSEYVSPVFNLVRSSTTYVDNLINANTVGETAAATGSGYLWNKYISKTVTLAEGQDAEDLKLLLTSYRPQGTDVKVWCKLLNGEDEDTFANRDWIELEKSDVANATFSSTSDRFDFVEYEYYIPEANKDANGIFTYTNSQGVTFEGYKYFAIKIGLLGTNSAKVPRVADLRFIALQL